MRVIMHKFSLQIETLKEMIIIECTCGIMGK
jgi:hypothetical protein